MAIDAFVNNISTSISDCYTFVYNCIDIICLQTTSVNIIFYLIDLININFLMNILNKGINFYNFINFRHRLRNAYETDWRNASRNVVAAVWDAHGWIWHGRKNYKKSSLIIPLVFLMLFSFIVFH